MLQRVEDQTTARATRPGVHPANVQRASLSTAAAGSWKALGTPLSPASIDAGCAGGLSESRLPARESRHWRPRNQSARATAHNTKERAARKPGRNQRLRALKLLRFWLCASHRALWGSLSHAPSQSLPEPSAFSDGP